MGHHGEPELDIPIGSNLRKTRPHWDWPTSNPAERAGAGERTDPHVDSVCDQSTIDLTKDGLAVPCVDDIASVSLDLWARERGYTRIKDNVLGF